MRLLGKLAIGGGAVSAATAAALVAGGVFATSATLVVGPAAGPAGADSLVRFDSCADLRDWYVQNNLSQVGPYGWGGPRIYMLNGTLDERAMAPVPQYSAKSMDSASNLARASSRTGTNTQEVDVDEPDVAKTDGRLLVRLTRPRHRNTDQMLAVSDVTGAEKNTLGRLHLPQTSYDSQLLLVGNKAVITQSVGGYEEPIRMRAAYGYDWPGTAPRTRVLIVDVSNPANPRLERTDVYSGSLLSARQYGDTVRLVTDTTRPDLDWWNPGEDHVSSRTATAHNKKVLKASTIEDWLPTVEHAGHRRRLLDCAAVLRPQKWSGSDTVTVSTFKPDAVDDRAAVGITASGGVVYSSTDRLYVASTEWFDPTMRDRTAVRPTTTDVHAFALKGTSTTYVGSGHIDGMVRDRWSLDEHDGNLRIAWSNPRGQNENGISVLAERDHALKEIGTLEGLGVNEDIQSVRWYDDLAVVVTYRSLDPLYTIDLSDPTRPHTLGELKIPGYSGYLHPLGDGLLLGLGVDGNAQAAVFDISNPRHTAQVSKVRFGPNSSLQAIDEPREFTWLPDKRTGVTVLGDWSRWTSRDPDHLRIEALEVSDDGTLTTRTVARLSEGWQPRILPLDDQRVAVVDGDRVQLVDIG
ncbi:MAG: beta-propeller domain-containing protein [Marmoricola sp.]